MGPKTDNSLVNVQLSKMEAAIENIVSLAIVGNLAVNKLMECEAIATITTNVASVEEHKWTTVMANNVCQVVSWAVETLVNVPK
jgi:hypothetical protein